MRTKKLKVEIKGPTKGVIVKADGQSLETYTLDNGFEWGDSKGRHQVGDIVIVKPYIMGTVTVEKVTS